MPYPDRARMVRMPQQTYPCADTGQPQALRSSRRGHVEAHPVVRYAHVQRRPLAHYLRKYLVGTGVFHHIIG